MHAMSRLPKVPLVLVATPESLAGANIPPNVHVRCNIPLAETMAILRGAQFGLVPLAGSQVPCGHVTLVAAMHCEKANIVSDSSGVADYIQNEVTGLTVAPRDAAALASCIDRLWNDTTLAVRLGTLGQQIRPGTLRGAICCGLPRPFPERLSVPDSGLTLATP